MCWGLARSSAGRMDMPRTEAWTAGPARRCGAASGTGRSRSPGAPCRHRPFSEATDSAIVVLEIVESSAKDWWAAAAPQSCRDFTAPTASQGETGEQRRARSVGGSRWLRPTSAGAAHHPQMQTAPASLQGPSNLAPRPGLEPGTCGLTEVIIADFSTS